ncbi:hypothetical protein [Burkholderia mallei]|uniref:Uncharacterized protein n=1 Tax=Burkholderia mallei TaxID=13373 RepID=A0AAX1XDN1_BURML|nr:hypothetical protein [Burkholderia mallei]ATD91004.1 hypothetical protein NM78_18635 [Burkholderia mallei]ATD96390.1 hypothetical protein NW91_22155 [Burkholderia mallei]ATE01246.1 hypothetical protein NW92_22775 [Burkholderia mallei]ATE06167.1 hypothetical protein NW93_23070 [Burkholderia mallei]ATE11039.1 hypothetical protein NW94_22860 [Burkholderia mallei]
MRTAAARRRRDARCAMRARPPAPGIGRDARGDARGIRTVFFRANPAGCRGRIPASNRHEFRMNAG